MEAVIFWCRLCKSACLKFVAWPLILHKQRPRWFRWPDAQGRRSILFTCFRSSIHSCKKFHSTSDKLVRLVLLVLYSTSDKLIRLVVLVLEHVECLLAGNDSHSWFNFHQCHATCPAGWQAHSTCTDKTGTGRMRVGRWQIQFNIWQTHSTCAVTFEASRMRVKLIELVLVITKHIMHSCFNRGTPWHHWWLTKPHLTQKH